MSKGPISQRGVGGSEGLFICLKMHFRGRVEVTRLLILAHIGGGGGGEGHCQAHMSQSQMVGGDLTT